MTVAGHGSIKVAEVTLTSAQVKAMNGTPIEVVPAPGVGKANIALYATAAVAFVSAAYATNTTITLGYGGAGISITGILAATSSKIAIAPPTVAALSYATAQNAAITVSASGGDPITGDSPVTVTVGYVTVNLP